MMKEIFLTTTLLVMSASSLAEEIFLDAQAKDYNFAEDSSWKRSPYAVDTTPTQDAFTGDKCTRGTEEQFTSLSNVQKKKNVECYTTHFPNSEVRTSMQSNEAGDVSVGFSWDLD
ncbi:hypothetical protein AB4441_24355 [Vibrio splendidus]